MKSKEELLQSATNSLIEAQKLCENANNQITKTRDQLVFYEKQSQNVHFQIDCIMEQHSFLQNSILKLKIGDQLINKEWKAVFFHELFQSLQKWQQQLQNKYKKLQATPYEIDETQDNLADFIDPESINAVQSKIDDFHITQEEIAKIEELYKKMIAKLQTKLAEKKIRRLLEKVAHKYSNDIQDQCTSYEEDLHNLELDLSDFLNSITSHFDKCQMLADHYDEELYKVVSIDDSKISDILESLSDISREATEVCSSVTDFFSRQETIVSIETLKTSMKSIIDEFVKLETQLLVFESVREVIANYKENSQNDIEEIKNLCDHYDKYLASYYNLLKEITRRRKVGHEMELILKDAQHKLAKIDEQDMKRRKKFLQDNGDSLPQDIWQPEISSLEPLYKLTYEIKKI
ncbi:hypothetical protein ACO0QE_001851 [Hanseniaspora vineae]